MAGKTTVFHYHNKYKEWNKLLNKLEVYVNIKVQPGMMIINYRVNKNSCKFYYYRNLNHTLCFKSVTVFFLS